MFAIGHTSSKISLTDTEKLVGMRIFADGSPSQKLVAKPEPVSATAPVNDWRWVHLNIDVIAGEISQEIH
jgi:hypothetical protein